MVFVRLCGLAAILECGSNFADKRDICRLMDILARKCEDTSDSRTAESTRFCVGYGLKFAIEFGLLTCLPPLDLYWGLKCQPHDTNSNYPRHRGLSS